MNADPSKTHRPCVRKSTDYRTLRLFAIGQAQGVISQKTVSTEETWTGLSRSDAEDLCVASVSSTLSGVTRNYLGGIKVRIGSGGVTAWAEADECWGRRVTTSIQRIGDTNLYSVSRTTEDMTAYGHGGEVTFL